MRNPRRAVVLGGILGLLLLLLSLLSGGWLAAPDPVHPGQGRDGYVPCPPGSHPKPGQRHICVPG